MSENKVAASAAEIAEAFKLQTAVVTVMGKNVKIQKMETLDFVGSKFMDIPLVRAALEGKADNISDEQKKKEIVNFIMDNQELLDSTERIALLKGAVEPKFSEKPEEGKVCIDSVSREFKSALANEIMKFSGFGSSVSSLFRVS